MSKADRTNCDMQEALVSYLYHEVSSDEARKVEDHLRQCSKCHQELAAFESVRGMLQRWQLQEQPAINVVSSEVERSPRRFVATLKELGGVMPWWGRALAGLAGALLIMAVLGTEVRIGSGGLAVRADLFGIGRGGAAIDGGVEPGATKDVRVIISELITESERQQREEIRVLLVGLESQLQAAHAADLAKLSTRIQQYRSRLQALERDLDRRDGLDLADLLFSGISSDAAGSSDEEAGSGSD